MQNSDGSIPAYNNCKWICLTGVAQIAVIAYKVGQKDFADKCMNYLAGVQNNTGGFLGSIGKGAKYFETEEISWAVKYYLDAFYWRQRSVFNKSAETFPHKIKVNDGRVKTVLATLGKY